MVCMSIELIAIIAMAVVGGGIMLVSCYGLRLEIRELGAELRGPRWEREQSRRYGAPIE